MDPVSLGEPSVYPDDELLEKLLGPAFPVYTGMVKELSGPGFDISCGWRYYNDGKSWLCKAVHKKKTVFWLSAREGFFRTTFYFTEKTGAPVEKLDISPAIKKSFSSAQHTGKLIPLTLILRERDQLTDLMKIVAYKLKT
ncbi:MAG TPA: DUF3788 family protein [Bacteroidales bacterium]|nr:DUF3788 family protein [Bacteroidales bacterium]